MFLSLWMIVHHHSLYSRQFVVWHVFFWQLICFHSLDLFIFHIFFFKFSKSSLSDLKFSNLLFQIFSFRSLYHHFSTTHHRWRQRKFFDSNDGFIEKNYMHFSTTHHRWLQRKIFDATTFTSPKTTMSKIHNRRAYRKTSLTPKSFYVSDWLKSSDFDNSLLHTIFQDHFKM